MTSLPPKIDQRTYEEIVEKTENLVQDFTDWQPVKGKTDAGGALIRIFGRMVKLVSDRLNQVPEKNFLAFLDLIGGQLNPPVPAKVPLTFYLAQGSPVDGLVPAYTQVSAPPVEGSDEEIVFETDRELVVTTAQLKAVFVSEPGNDRYSDRSLSAMGEQDKAFLAFEGDKAMEHYLYINCPEIFSLPELTNFQLIFNTNNATLFQGLQLSWSYWDGSKWKEIDTPSSNNKNHQSILKFNFSNLPIPTATKINEQTAQWLRASLTNITDISNNLPEITNIKGKISITQYNLVPDICLFNNIPLDLTKDFYPFGEQPVLNDTFYIALHDDFIKPGVAINIDIEYTYKPVNTNNLKITWEIANNQEWQEIKVSTNNISEKLELPNLENIPFPNTVNGETRYWIRARITQGNYGKPASERKYPLYSDLAVITANVNENEIVIKVDSLDLFNIGDKIRLLPNTGGFPEEHEINAINQSSNQLTLNSGIINKNLAVGTRVMGKSIITEYIPPTYDPPLIKSLKLKYEFILEEDSNYFAYNNFKYSYPHKINFKPFTQTTYENSTLCLGFDKSFDNKTVTLYTQVEPPSPDELSTDTPLETVKPELIWEYYSTNGFQRLAVKDESQAFSQSGLIQFIAPPDFTKIEIFGKQLYWLRIRWVHGNFRVKPRLRHILTNTTWAIQAISLKKEILGSSNYEPNQTFIPNNTPILMGQQLEVQEGQIPLELESDKIKFIRDELGEIEEVWVLWQEVADFYGSTANHRHYTLDRQTGEIRFGDGQTGMIPPRGRNNIRLHYRTGGGKQGNISAQTITQLKTTIPYIDRVINLEPSAGGAEQETLERLKTRVPKELRHRDRAVTIDDMADLAYEASTDVARVKVVTPDLMTVGFSPLNENLWIDPNKSDISFQDILNEKLNQITKEEDKDNFQKMMEEINQGGGQVKLIILPDSKQRQPIPSLALLEQVESYIRSRCQGTVDLIVTAPKWQKVTVNATISPISLEATDILINTIKQRLEAFLHPLTGGTGEGWKFGRYPQKSDIYAIIQSIPGVDFVNSLSLSPTEINQSLSADTLIYSGNHTINLQQ